MADDVKVIVQGDVEKYLQRVVGNVNKELVTALLQAAVHAEGELKQAIASVFSSGGTGELARNPKAVLLETNGQVKSSGAFLDLVYARIQDEGGVDYPKSAKALAVPISDYAKKIPGLWPRHWPKGKLTLIPSKDGGPASLCEKIGRGKQYKLKAHYILKKSNTIVGMGYVERARQAAEKTIKEIIGNHIGVAIKRSVIA